MTRFRNLMRTWGPWLALAVLNIVLFVPSYLFAGGEAVSHDPTPEQASNRGGLAGWPALAIGVFQPDVPEVLRISVELVLLTVLLIGTASLRARAAVRVLSTAGYVWLVVFLAYHHAIGSLFHRPPALSEDYRLLLNLAHLLGSVMSLRWAAILASFVAGLWLLTLAAALTFRAVQHRAARWTLARRLGVALAFLVPAGASLALVGVRGDAPVIQVLAKQVLENIRNSRADAARFAVLDEPTPDRRYDPFLELTLERKPNFYWLMIEAYGEVLATWDMRDAYRALLERAESRLREAGYHMRSVYSAAPVHSGTSWYSIATVHTGTRIDRPDPYQALQMVGARVPTVTRFFDAQGYRTYTLQPGNHDHAGLRRFDLYNHDVVVEAPELGYRGPAFGWGVIPDQFAWGRFRERWFAEPVAPYYVFYMSVSTHWEWEAVPPYVRDYASLERDPPPPESDERWPPLPHLDAIGGERRRDYFRSIEYEWRVLLDVLEADASPDIVVAIVGDHQPRLFPPDGVTMATPVHMLSRDPAFIESFADVGFQPGLYVEPGRHPVLRHEGLFSLWVSKLTAAYGAPGSPGARHYPEGIRLSTIRR